MANFAVLDGENIINIIIADSKEIVEEITGKVCVEYTTEMVSVGGTYDGVHFIPNKPYPSWILNSNKQWEAPIPMPTPEYFGEDSKLEGIEEFYCTWDEESVSWIKHFN